MSNDRQEIIVFFDGVCGLCNTLVDFLIKRDKQRKLLFAPLQGETAMKLLLADEIKTLDTLILWVDGEKYSKSNAVFKLFTLLGRPYSLVVFFRLFPSVLNDWCYSLIAKKRYVWFGQKTSCRIPSSSEKSVLLP